jgi:hypothetical protein
MGSVSGAYLHFHPPLMAIGIMLRQYRTFIEADFRTIVRERIGLEKDDRATALATYIIGEMERRFPDRPTGRCLLQKLFYILSREGHVDDSFDLFMNGPYSDRVESALGQAVECGMMTVVKENGRSSISARGGISGEVPAYLKKSVSQCIRAYGFYDESDLAILTTALFLEDRGHQRPAELVKAVISINPQFDPRRVCSLLDRSDVVYRSW